MGKHLPGQYLPSPGEILSDADSVEKHLQLLGNMLGATLDFVPGGGLMKLGVGAIAGVWPTGDTTKWDLVFQSMAQAVDKALRESVVDSAKANLLAVEEGIFTDYLPYRNDGKTDKGTLIATLQSNITLLRATLKQLERKEVEWYGIEPYCFGVNLLLALMQERALQDPAVTDPHESTTAGELSKEARSRSERMTLTMNAMVARRIELIGPVNEYTPLRPTAQGGVHWPLEGYEFHDDFDDSTHRVSPKWTNKKNLAEAKETTEQQRRSHVDVNSRAYENALTKFRTMVERWRFLATSPLHDGPFTAPTYDPHNWAKNLEVPGTRWVYHYAVRYRVTFIKPDGIESAPGPWWKPKGASADGYFGSDAYGVPYLIDIPIAHYKTPERRIYRQFLGHDDIELVTVIKDNTTTRAHDYSEWGVVYEG